MTSIGWATTDWSRTWLDDSGNPVIGGAGHYRMALPSQALRVAGHRSVLGTLFGNQETGELGILPWGGEPQFGFDVIVIQRWMHRVAAEVIRRARALGQVIVNDVDDWWDGVDPANPAFAMTSAKNNAANNRDHYRQSLAASDLIVCSTPFLATRLKNLAPTRLIRNRLDLHRWTLSEPRRGPITVGWVGVTGMRSAGDLESLRGVLGPFLDRHDGWGYHGGHRWGDPTFPERTGTNPVRMHTRAMTTVDEYPSLFEGFDVGVVPLADKPFNEAKSAIKGMEYAAAGLPFVASGSGEYRWLADQGIGRSARRPRDWVHHLEQLERMGPEGRAEEGRRNALLVSKLDVSGLAAEWSALLRTLDVGRVAVPVPAASPLLVPGSSGLIVPGQAGAATV